MLKGVRNTIIPHLTALFNESGEVPLDWKTSSVVPIPKTKKGVDNPCNYRPISLLSVVVSQLLEKHIFGIVQEHVMVTDQVPSTQWGFTPGRTTVENYGTSLTHIDVFSCYIRPLIDLTTPYLAHAPYTFLTCPCIAIL